MKHPSSLALGATLYMPATRTDIIDVILHNKIADLRSMVICLEDSVLETDIPTALDNLKIITDQLSIAATDTYPYLACRRPMVFIRPRNIAMAKQIVAQMDLSGIDGMVLPKFTLADVSEWLTAIGDAALLWMPTLETADVFNLQQMQELAERLAQTDIHPKIIALRVGGNDLMSILGIRRSRTQTLYEGPLGYLIKMLVCTFSAKGFALTSAVFELIDNPQLLEKELQQDLAHGMVGKTAIHPSQIDIIHKAFAVEHCEYEDALRIVNASQAVFKFSGAMCEPTTHKRWADNLLQRCQHYGFKPNLALNDLNRFEAPDTAQKSWRG